MTTPEYVPNNDAELQSLVRELTDYDDTVGAIEQAGMEAMLQIGKLKLSNKVGSDNFYGDPGLAQALLGVTGVLIKCRVENYSVDSVQLGDQDITVADPQADSLQFKQWNELYQEGIDASRASPDSGSRLRNTSGFIS